MPVKKRKTARKPKKLVFKKITLAGLKPRKTVKRKKTVKKTVKKSTVVSGISTKAGIRNEIGKITKGLNTMTKKDAAKKLNALKRKIK